MPVTRSMTGVSQARRVREKVQQPPDDSDREQPQQQQILPHEETVVNKQYEDSQRHPAQVPLVDETFMVNKNPSIISKKSSKSRKSEIMKLQLQAELTKAKKEIAMAKKEEVEILLKKQELEEEEDEEDSPSQLSRQRVQQWVDQHSNFLWEFGIEHNEDLNTEYRKINLEEPKTEQFKKDLKTEQYRRQKSEEPTRKKIPNKLEEKKTESYITKNSDYEDQSTEDINWEEEKKYRKIRDENQRMEERRRLTKQKPEDSKKEPNQKIDLTELASAIAQAAQRYVTELPYFNGAYQDWLAFLAAYKETEKHFTEVENTARLRRALKGRAYDAVRCLLIANTKPEDILETLETRFGRPDSIALSELENLKTLQRTTESSQDICLFATEVQNSVATLEALQRRHYLYNPEVLKILTHKLTPTLRSKWLDIMEDKTNEEPDLVTFSKFITKEARKVGRFASPERIKDNAYLDRQRMNEPRKEHHRTEEPYHRENKRGFYRFRSNPQRIAPRQDRIYRASAQKKQHELQLKCDLCQASHETKVCKKFTESDTDDRWRISKEHKLCFRCLKKRTLLHKCDPHHCEVDGCEKTHHPLLHFTIKKETKKKPRTEERVTSAATQKHFSFLKILPVTIKGPQGEMNTFALLDDGSTVTLLDETAAKQIGCRGPTEPLQIEAVAGAKLETNTSQQVTFKIKGRQNEYPIKARTVEELNLAPQAVRIEDIENCQHLKDIKELLQYTEGKPTLLIGQDNWQFLIADTVRKGPADQPVASLTPLGWVLHGVNTRSLGRQVNYCYRMSETELDEQIRRYFAIDSLGVTERKPRNDPEERALMILREKTVERPGSGYETGLLWKKDNPDLPNNYDQALKRLYGIEKKLDKDPQLREKYEKQIENMIKKGYAEEVVTSPKPGRTWYLPHFAVVHPAKPGKVRVVYDAAAKTAGTSLNDHLLPGPDLLQSLPGVLMRFRQHPIAVAADIEEMFLRIGIIEEDRDALRFLWRQDRREGPPTEYRMKSVIFGATSSPCTALYIKNFNAEKYKEEYPEARDAIISHHYMDDYLQSFRNEDEAIKIATEVRLVHQKGNFNLRKWSSNNQEVMTALRDTTDETTNEVKLDDGIKDEKILGLVWKPREDKLAFNLNFSRIPEDIVKGTRIPTKREALKTVMSLYDPLGLVSPITNQAKQILQETWRHGTGWDEELPKDAKQKWKLWISNMQNLRNLEIPRCHPKFSTAKERELHIFVDASETAYAAAVYWRVIDKEGKVNVALAAAKARVAPLKLTSIPRLELQAAVLGSRLAKTVTEEYQLKPNKRYFWTDSKIVLQWLRSGPRVFKSFVAHRVAEIEEETTVNEWRWIPTTHNVADDATRDVPVNFTQNHRWFNGPDFLKMDPQAWPKEKESEIIKTGEERVNVIQNEGKILTESLPDISRFSSWLRLIRTTARVLQFINLLKKPKERVNYKTSKRTEKDPDWRRTQKRESRQPNRPQGTSPQQNSYLPLDGELIRKAEELWIKASQAESFPEELIAFNKQKEVSKESRLRQLAIVTEDSILKLKSRIAAATEVSSQQKQPPILDGDHRYTRLYLEWLHHKLHHAGTEMIVNEARQHYWILRLRPTAKNITKSCLKCRIKKTQPTEPPTGDHPYARLAHHQRPFTFTGVDYFGPLSVTVGRSHQKRYVALFTCLTTRAVHLEIASNLSTDSAISALRRFIARRGCPTEIYSDNGTNLHGADREIRKSLQDEAANHRITWKFIPPGAPFMGGAWERLVRSVKTALYSVLEDKHPQEETLATLLCEVEYTVNSRPLTHVSTSPEEDETLTPNHFLLGGSGNVNQFGHFTEIDLKLRQQWKHAQRLADVFWQRWLKEYLPELQYRREPRGYGKQLQEGDLVLIVDSNLPRNTWPRGRIIKVYPGQDGIVRAVDVQTTGGILRRPTKRLVVLPVNTEE